MHFTTITTLLLPLLLSSVLAAPTSTTPQVGNPGALIPRLSCADGFGADECDPNEPPALPSSTYDQIQSELPPGPYDFQKADDLIMEAQEAQDGKDH